MKEKSNSFDPKDYGAKKGQVHRKTFDIRILVFDVVGFAKDLFNERAAEIVTDINRVMWDILDKDHYWAEKQSLSARNDLILVPTGDGYGIAFHPNIEDSEVIDICVRLHKALVRKLIKIRMGVAKGNTVVTFDLNDNLNIFGHGIVLATRVCSVAKKKQILFHRSFAESLTQQKPVEGLIELDKPLKAKHGLKLYCYNYHRKGEFGIEVKRDV